MMELQNDTTIREFILLSMSSAPKLRVMYFLLFLLMYLTTLSGNITLVLLVMLDSHLRTPMYFFLSNLSFIDLCFSSSVAPKIMENILRTKASISFQGCAAQLYFTIALGATECITLAEMALDRYVAICMPLRYPTIMNRKLCCQLAGSAWALGVLNAAMHTYLTFRLPYCKSRNLEHYLCEMPPLFRLACSDTTFNQIMVYISTVVISLFNFPLTLVSYTHILAAILKMRSAEGRRKAFSTCGSHLTVVSLYYGTIIFMYLRPQSSYSPERDKVTSVLYTVVTPMLNPMIYSMRNNDVKGALRRVVHGKTQCFRM